MRVPFRNEFDELFRSDRRIWLKIGGGAVLGALLGIAALARSMRNAEPSIGVLGTLVVLPLVGALAATVLSLKDVVQRRIRDGRPVNFLLRLFFGMGFLSFVLGTVTVFLLAILGVYVLLVHVGL